MQPTAAVRQPPPTTSAPKRMTLTSIQRTKKPVPDKILVSGTPGIGKSTFAADAPGVIFIASEEGLSHIEAQAFPEPQTYSDVLEAVQSLIDNPHDFKTLAIDSLDWIEPLIHAEVCQRNKWESIESVGYGKGHVVALDEWRKLYVKLDRLRRERDMEIILIAHVTIKQFSNPAGADYSRYEIKLHRGAAALAQEWVSSHLFAMHEEFTQKEGFGKTKGTSTGRRVVYTQRTAAYDAKSRVALPPVLPLSYAEYAAAREKHQVASPETLATEARALVASINPDAETRGKMIVSIEDAGSDAGKLARIVDRLRTVLATKEGEA